MAANIGSVTLDYPLYWINKPVASLGKGRIGADVRTITGDMVFIISDTLVGAKPVEAIFLFEWESFATVEALMDLWDAGAAVSCDFEDSGDTYTFRFAVEDGITDVENVAFGEEAPHEDLDGLATDLYQGRIKGWITAGL